MAQGDLGYPVLKREVATRWSRREINWKESKRD
jgi:hypothetical protein